MLAQSDQSNAKVHWCRCLALSNSKGDWGQHVLGKGHLMMIMVIMITIMVIITIIYWGKVTTQVDHGHGDDCGQREHLGNN